MSHNKDESILLEANRLIHGERQQDYNHPLDNFKSTADLWSAYKGVSFTPEDVAIFMILAKISREGYRPKRDNRVDIAGYIGCLQELIDERERRERHNPLAGQSVSDSNTGHRFASDIQGTVVN